MQTLTADEFKKRYGEEGIKSFGNVSQVQKPGLVSRIGTDLSKRAEDIATSFKREVNPEGTPLGGIRLGLRTVGSAAGGVTDVLGETIKSVSDATGVTETIKPVGIALLNTEIGKMGLEAIQSGVESYNSFKEKHPDVASSLEDVVNISSLLPIEKAFVGTGKIALKAGEKTISGAEDIANGTIKAVRNSKIIDSNINPEKIMQRVARIPKGAQAKFEQTSGESVGKYLNKRNIYGDSEQISKQLFDRFSTSRNAADKALAKLEGEYKPLPLKNALKELVEREKRVSSVGARSKDYVRTVELANKYNKNGLNMSEINEVKRLFERNVRLDFVKSLNTDGITKSTNIDNALREWQFNQAEKLGLKNLPEINKETRLAKQLLDDIGKEIAGSAGNNAIPLTDIILLASGDPAVIAGYFVKKGLSSKKLQSNIAQKLYKGEKVGLPEAEFGSPKPGLKEFLSK